jgi:hypothetical protein
LCCTRALTSLLCQSLITKLTLSKPVDLPSILSQRLLLEIRYSTEFRQAATGRTLPDGPATCAREHCAQLILETPLAQRYVPKAALPLPSWLTPLLHRFAFVEFFAAKTFTGDRTVLLYFERLAASIERFVKHTVEPDMPEVATRVQQCRIRGDTSSTLCALSAGCGSRD